MTDAPSPRCSSGTRELREHIAKERAAWDHKFGGKLGIFFSNDELELLEAALSSPTPQAQAGGVAQAGQKPVAWRWHDEDPNFNQAWSYTEVDITERGKWVVEPLFAAPQPANIAYTAWLPIDTQPPAGTVIDVWMVLPSGHGARWTSVMWGNAAQRWIGGPPSQDPQGWKATHWMRVR